MHVYDLSRDTISDVFEAHFVSCSSAGLFADMHTCRTASAPSRGMSKALKDEVSTHETGEAVAFKKQAERGS